MIFRGTAQSPLRSHALISGRIFVLLSGMALVGCNSSGTNTVDEALNVPSQTNQQIASVPAPDKIQDPRAYCPKTVLRAGTETFDVYPDGRKTDENPDRSQLQYRATISDVARECARAGTFLNMKVGVRGRYLTGPKGEAGGFNMPIRVAVTRGDEVLYSQLHQVPANLAPGQTNNTFSYVDGNVSFPVPDAENIIVYVGFDEGPYDTE